MLLNARSRLFNYHQAMNAMLLWDHKVPKRLVQTLSQLLITASYAFQCRSVQTVALDEVRRAKIAAADESKVKLFPYDNFNWVSCTFEPSAEHGNVTHDEVSALLIILKLPDGPDALTASEYANVQRFEETAGAHHRMPAAAALRGIIPTMDNQKEFRKNSILHIAQILVEEVPSFSCF
jgi:hypothetical protein